MVEFLIDFRSLVGEFLVVKKFGVVGRGYESVVVFNGVFG